MSHRELARRAHIEIRSALFHLVVGFVDSDVFHKLAHDLLASRRDRQEARCLADPADQLEPDRQPGGRDWHRNRRVFRDVEELGVLEHRGADRQHRVGIRIDLDFRHPERRREDRQCRQDQRVDAVEHGVDGGGETVASGNRRLVARDADLLAALESGAHRRRVSFRPGLEICRVPACRFRQHDVDVDLARPDGIGNLADLEADAGRLQSRLALPRTPDAPPARAVRRSSRPASTVATRRALSPAAA